jgi:MFS family permease
LFAHRGLDARTLTVPWLVAAGLACAAATIVLFVRPDPRRIAELLATHAGEIPQRAAPLSEIVGRPGVVPAMLAALASQGVMVSVMNLAGYVVVEHHHHAQSSIFPVIGAHVLGMYALVLVVGTLVDRMGRTPSLVAGLVVLGFSGLGLEWASSVAATAVLLFGLGIGWNISYVAAAAQLADRTQASERGTLFGFNDLISALLGATLALLGGLALETIGVAGLAVGAAVIAIAPIAWILRRPPARPLGEAA